MSEETKKLLEEPVELNKTKGNEGKIEWWRDWEGMIIERVIAWVGEWNIEIDSDR